MKNIVLKCLDWNRMVIVLGICCLLAGTILIGRIPYLYIHSFLRGHQLLNQANHMVHPLPSNLMNNKTIDVETPSQPAAQNIVIDPQELIGKLEIPSVGMQVPLLVNTEDTSLSVGAGHLSTSVMPGKNGTSVIAAHNDTWFRHLDQLKKGDLIQVSTKSGTFTYAVDQSQILRTGDPIYESDSPSIVLETCYPLDDLNLTPYRYLVFGKLKS